MRSSASLDGVRKLFSTWGVGAEVAGPPYLERVVTASSGPRASSQPWPADPPTTELCSRNYEPRKAAMFGRLRPFPEPSG